MWQEEGFSKLEKNYLWFFLLLLLFGFFYQLGIYPLFLEEPRRGLIALEMVYRENLWVPTQTGDLYFRKPPFYNWVLILAYRIFGETEFATRFFSVLSHLLLGGMTYFFSRKYLGEQKAIIISFSYLLCEDILFYFSTLGEIDLFYAFVTGGSIFLIFHFGEKKKHWALFLSVYVLTAIGFLTKGLSSLPYTAISLLVYFIWTKDFKRLLSVQHFAGIGVFVLILFGYFYQYSRFQEVSGWWSTLYSESADKATGGGLSDWFSHFVSFPFDTIKNLLPATFALPLLFLRGTFKRFKENRLVWFSLLVFLFNVIVYWVSSEGRSRYVYPVFPFAVIAMVYLLTSTEVKWKAVYLRIVAIVLLVILIAGFSSIPFITSLSVVDNRFFLSIIGILMLGISGFLLLTNRVSAFLVILSLFVVLRIGFSVIVPQTREKTTGAAKDKALGIELAELTKGEPLHRLGEVRISYTIVFYLERDRGEVLYKAQEFESGYYLCYLPDLPNGHYEELRRFDYHGEPVSLIKYLP